MLNTLIESRSRSKRNTSGTVVAVTLHALIIGGAAYATATAATTPNTRRQEVPHFVTPKSSAVVKQDVAPKRPGQKSPQRTSVPQLSINISPNLPPIDIPLADPSREATSDFPVCT